MTVVPPGEVRPTGGDHYRVFTPYWQAWDRGLPIVDAGMRQLLAEGGMHNRARMVVASFLTKQPLIDPVPGHL